MSDVLQNSVSNLGGETASSLALTDRSNEINDTRRQVFRAAVAAFQL